MWSAPLFKHGACSMAESMGTGSTDRHHSHKHHSTAPAAQHSQHQHQHQHQHQQQGLRSNHLVHGRHVLSLGIRRRSPHGHLYATLPSLVARRVPPVLFQAFILPLVRFSGALALGRDHVWIPFMRRGGHGFVVLGVRPRHARQSARGIRAGSDSGGRAASGGHASGGGG